MDSDRIANKHVTIGSTIYKDVVEHCPSLRVYLATHSDRTEYKIAEKNSGLEFWGIKLYAGERPSGRGIKQPDGIITDGGTVLYILEIKWGWIPDSRMESDLSMMVKSGELTKIRDAIREGKSCRIAALDENFRITEETKCLLVSDFRGMVAHDPSSYDMVMESLDKLEDGPVRLDYKHTYDFEHGRIQSFRDYISSTE